MKLGFVGLGRMGSGMISRALDGGFPVIGYDRDQNLKTTFSSHFERADSLQSLCEKLRAPEDTNSTRAIWLMVPAGAPVDSCIEQVIPHLTSGDIIVDGGNSNFRDSKRRAELCSSHGLDFIDVGTSGGIWGESMGFCMMIGGSDGGFRTLEPLLRVLAPEDGYSYMGPAGSGHYVKMVHNAIEYGMMQAYAEGVDLLTHGPYNLSLKDIVKVWNRGGVIRSWLLELAENMLEEDPMLDKLEGYIEDSGTGRWAIEEALKANVPVPVLSTSLFTRFRSRRTDSISDRFIAGLRKGFGGHSVKPKP